LACRRFLLVKQEGTPRPRTSRRSTTSGYNSVVNRNETTPAVFVGARNEPTAQESVVMLPDLDSLIP
jgi:hypothetical protein